MKMLPKVRAAVSAIGEQMERIRLYQGFVLNDVHRLSPAARRRLGLSD